MSVGKDVGLMGFASDIFQTSDRQKPLLSIRMPDQSMQEANIVEGDILIIDLTESIKTGDIALVVYNTAAMVRRVCYKADASIELQAANPQYKTILVKSQFVHTPEIFKIIGCVVYVITRKDIESTF